jgi:hypothetical protein
MLRTACDEKLRLFAEYQLLMQAYTATMSEVVMRGTPYSEYGHVCAGTGKARHDSIAAWDRLERHVTQHGC